MKRLLSLFLVTVMLASTLASCLDQTHEDETGDATVNTTESTQPTTEQNDVNKDPEIPGTKFALNNTATWVKKLDSRMEANKDYITCDWSASGIEFTATCSGDVTFDVNVTTKMGGGKEGCYFRAYVDGNAWKNGDSDYFEAKGESLITLKNLPEGTHTVKLVKVTGYTLANAELRNVYLTGTVAQEAPAQKQVYLEFVGDSISCGWGVVGNHDGAYTDQDATLAYPALIADALEADYSVVALSGQGLIAGNPNISNGYKYASPFRSKTAEFGFSRKADVVVINADTNDASQNYPKAEYIKVLKAFVTYVREKNGADTHIVLVCNMMKTTYSEEIEKYVEELGGDENKYYFYKATPAGGTAAGNPSSHPTAAEHVAYAEDLGGVISSILDGTYSEDGTPKLPTKTTTIFTQNFDSVSTPADAGIVNLTACTIAATITDGKLNVPSTGWSGGCPGLVLVGRDTFTNAPGKYVLEMDLTFSKLATFALILNGNTTDAIGVDKYSRANTPVVMVRQTTNDKELNDKGQIGSFSNGTIANKKIWLRGMNFTADNKQNVPENSDHLIKTLDASATNFSLKLSIVMDSTPEGSCNMQLFVDGTYVYEYSYGSDAFDATANSYISLWAQDTAVTIDNLTVKTFS